MASEEPQFLADEVARARRAVASELSDSPAWDAAVAWLEELDDLIRQSGLDPDDLADPRSDWCAGT